MAGPRPRSGDRPASPWSLNHCGTCSPPWFPSARQNLFIPSPLGPAFMVMGIPRAGLTDNVMRCRNPQGRTTGGPTRPTTPPSWRASSFQMDQPLVLPHPPRQTWYCVAVLVLTTSWRPRWFAKTSPEDEPNYRRSMVRRRGNGRYRRAPAADAERTGSGPAAIVPRENGLRVTMSAPGRSASPGS